MTNTSVVISLLTDKWNQLARRASSFLAETADDALEQPVAPGKNTGNYLVGHLIAIHDQMDKILGTGVPKYAELMETYVQQPDGAGAARKSIAELRPLWTETHDRIGQAIKQIPDEEWFKRHTVMSDEDFAKNPMRNKLSVLVSRLEHFSYHFGQLRLLSKAK